MIPLYTEQDFQTASSRKRLPFECICCGKTFYKPKNKIQAMLRGNCNYTCSFCCLSCKNTHKSPPQTVICTACGKPFKKVPSQIKKSTNHFCSHSCNALWQNAHKTIGTRRSKLEIWLELQLQTLYSELEIQFNRKDAIDSELDIYVPSLKLAFELNGIFHYEPIYGDKKLVSTQANDHRKMLACAERDISLCVIDSTSMKNFKPLKAQKFLDIIIRIINDKLGWDGQNRTAI